MRAYAWVVVSVSWLVSCSTVVPPSSPRPGEAPAEPRALWGRELYDGPHGEVLAAHRWLADEMHDWLRRVHGWFAEQDIELRRGLVIAIDYEDPLLAKDPAEHLMLLNQWHARSVGRVPPTPAKSLARAGEPLRGHWARLFAAGVRPDEPGLQLPSALRSRVDWVLVVPTSHGLDRIFESQWGESEGRMSGVERMQRVWYGEVGRDAFGALFAAHAVESSAAARILDRSGVAHAPTGLECGW